jgi:plastocyanin
MTCRLVLGLVLAAGFGIQIASGQESGGGAKTGEIYGRISVSGGRIRNGALPAQPKVDRYRLHGDHADHAGSPGGTSSDTVSQGIAGQVVVYLEGRSLEGDPFVPPAEPPVLNQKGLQFHPQVLAVQAGTSVDFPNRDNLYHNVFSYSSPNDFDLGRYPLNDSRSVRFDRPGIVRVYCDIHSHMNATILVLSHHYFTGPDARGNYRIPDVPEGKYSLVVWFGRDVAERIPVTVVHGQRLEVNVSL